MYVNHTRRSNQLHGHWSSVTRRCHPLLPWTDWARSAAGHIDGRFPTIDYFNQNRYQIKHLKEKIGSRFFKGFLGTIGIEK